MAGAAEDLMATHSGLLRAIGEGLVSWSYFAIVWLILWYLYRKGTFVRI